MNVQGMIGAATDSRRSLIISMAIIVVLSLVITGLIIALIFARRKADTLQAYIRKLEEDKEQRKEDLKLAKEAAVQKKLQAEIAELEGKIVDAKELLVLLEKKRRKFNDDMKGVTEWDDLDVSPPPAS